MISLIEKGKITDLQGNILTSSQQSVQNWTPAGTGTVDLSYADGVNHAEFDTTGGVDLFSKKINQYLGTNISVNSTMYQNLCTDYNYNADHRNWKLVIAQQNNSVKFWLGANNSKDSTNTYVSGQQYIYTYNSTYTDVNTRSITFTNAEAMFFNNYNDFCQFFMIGITFSKNYTLSFNAGDKLASKQQLVDYINNTEFDGMTMQLLDYSALWERYGVNTVYSFWKANSYFYFLATDETCNGIKFRQGTGSLSDRFYYDPYSGNSGHCTVVLYEISGHTIGPIHIGTGDNVIPSSGAFVMNIDSELYNVSQNTNTSYLLTLSTRSTTGFTKDTSKHDITLTNGNNTYTFEVNPTARQEYQQQSILFTPTSASCNLKLDLSGMQGSGIEIDVKDIGVYEIGGEE